MKEDLKKVRSIRDMLIDLQLDLDMANNELAKINSELETLYNLECTLIDNLRILKKEKVIAIASQYKESITQLQNTQSGIRYRIGLKKQMEQKHKNIYKNYTTYQDKYDQIMEKVGKQKVVLLFDPKKKRNTD